MYLGTCFRKNSRIREFFLKVQGVERDSLSLMKTINLPLNTRSIDIRLRKFRNNLFMVQKLLGCIKDSHTHTKHTWSPFYISHIFPCKRRITLKISILFFLNSVEFYKISFIDLNIFSFAGKLIAKKSNIKYILSLKILY